MYRLAANTGNNFNGYNFANVEPRSRRIPTMEFLISALIPKIKRKKGTRLDETVRRRLVSIQRDPIRAIYTERYDSSRDNCAIRQRELGFRSCCYSQSRTEFGPVGFARTIRVLSRPCGQRLRKRRCR